MFVFGHVGIGSKLASPWAKGLPKRWVLLGTMLPDLVDKPVYYLLSWTTGKSGLELGLISGTRTFGHTALFLFAIAFVSIMNQSKLLAALALGVATHLLLDNLGDRSLTMHSLLQFPDVNPVATVHALLFPLLGYKFPAYPFLNSADHATSLWKNPYVLGGELIGAAILAWDVWKIKRKKEILEMLLQGRIQRKLLKKRRSDSRGRS